MLRLIKPCPELENAYEDFRADWKANHDKIIPAAVRGEGMNYAQLQSYLRGGNLFQIPCKCRLPYSSCRMKPGGF